MASNVFPMLSSSPPPMDDCPDDDDDDDEFGNFTSANIPFDSSFDSPVNVDKFKSFKSGDNGVVNDANFPEELHKFNSKFSNSTTPPQDFLPSFPEENEHCKNGFKPMKSEKCKIPLNDLSLSLNEDSVSPKIVASHKPVPLKTDCILHSSSNSKSLASESGDTLQILTSENSGENNLKKGTLKLHSNEYDSSEEESSPICDSTREKVITALNHLPEVDSTHITCNDRESAFESVVETGLLKVNTDLGKISLNEESGSLSDKKFTCDFNLENSEDSHEEFDDFQQSENFSCNFQTSESFPCDFQALEGSESFSCNFQTSEIFSSDVVQQSEKFSSCQAFSSNLSSSDGNNYVPSEQDSSEEGFKTCFESKPITENSNEFSDTEFDDFQGCGEENVVDEAVASTAKSEDDLEFDDFQDFQCSGIPNEETEEFADFQDFSVTDASDRADDFADFSAAPFGSNKKPSLPESCEFADFEEAALSTPMEGSFQTSSTSQKSVDTLSTVINAIFPLSDSPHDGETSDETLPQILEQTNKSRRLWEKLHEVEQTPGLRFQWGVSHSFQQLLRSVNVDYHSILRTSSVPIFASGLSLLEPVKGHSSSVNHESEDRTSTPKDPIPPVEFDWTSSGLINPLDSGQAVSTLMDLSFLSSVNTNTNVTNNDHSFENELLKPSPAPLYPKSSSKTQILEQLLSKNVSSLPSSKITHRPSNLSDEAIRVLDQLTDLSFMQAKVLMFPISKT